MHQRVSRVGAKVGGFHYFPRHRFHFMVQRRMLIRNAWLLFAVLCSVSSCQSASPQASMNDSSMSTDLSLVGDAAMLGDFASTRDFSLSGSIDLGGPSDGGGPKVTSCNKGCATVADCDQGSAAFDSDNYNCTASVCVYTGCNNDAECKTTFSNSAYVCAVVSGLRSCVHGCSTSTDCNMGSPAFDADNYNCTAGACQYKGCNNDTECATTFSNSAYICRVVSGIPSCVHGCSTSVDCNMGSPAFDTDNYNCTAGFCDYKGCNNDAECKSSFGSAAYVCRS